MRRKQPGPESWLHANPAIKYLTENGFSILRRSEVDPWVIDTPAECRFLVQRENETQSEVRVHFDEALIATLGVRRQVPFSKVSKFWLVCAESRLANYLWEENALPRNGVLTIKELSPDELMLALHWHDRN